jgi:hypothetical protein
MRINFSMSARFAGDIFPLAAGDIKTHVVTTNINSVLSIVPLLWALFILEPISKMSFGLPPFGGIGAAF